MTKDEAIKMAKAKLECLERSTSGLFMNCNNDCENCRLNYDQGNVGEQKELLKMMITILNQGPVYLQPCVDCNTKMNEIREAYDKLKKQEPCEDAVTPRKGWISVEEDTPPKGTICLWCNKQGSVFTSAITLRMEKYSYVGQHGWFSNGLENHGNIVAWMPLPEPYGEIEGREE